MREEITLAFIFAYIVNSVLCDKAEVAHNLQKREVVLLDEKDMIFPAAEAIDASVVMTNHRKLYEDKKHRVDGTAFSHRRMGVRPQLATHTQMHTVGGQVNYMNKPTDVLLTFRTQRTDNNPAEVGLDGKVNLYTSPLGKLSIDGNLGYSRLIGVPAHMASPAWEAGLEANLLNTIFLRGSITLRL